MLFCANDPETQNLDVKLNGRIVSSVCVAADDEEDWAELLMYARLPTKNSCSAGLMNGWVWKTMEPMTKKVYGRVEFFIQQTQGSKKGELLGDISFAKEYGLLLDPVSWA